MKFKLKSNLDQLQLNAVQTIAQLENNQVAKLLAVAGSGKTTTLIESVKELINQNKLQLNSNIILQFNKNIATETQAKIQFNKLNNHIESKTVHSVFYWSSQEIQKFFAKLDVKINSENFKATSLVNMYVNTYCKQYDIDVEQRLSLFAVNDMSRLFDLVRLFAITNFDNSIEEINSIIERYTLNISSVALQLLLQLLNDSYPTNFKDMKVFNEGSFYYNFYSRKDKKNVKAFCQNKNNTESYMFIDFTDMLYLPFKYYSKVKDKINTYEYIFVDEAQDLSKLDYALIQLIKQDNSKLIYVGDHLQAINMFKGALPELYKDLVTEYNCELNYNYRSGSDIIKFVSENTICNNIVSGLNTQGIINTDYLNDNTEHDNKIDAFVSELKTFSENKEVSEKHLILSEKNDVLINIYIKLLKSNVKDISLKGLNDLLPIFKEVMKFENSKLNIKAIEDNDSIDKVLNTIQTKLNFQRKNLKDRFNFESENEYNKDTEYLNYSTLLYMVSELNTINEYKDKEALEVHLSKILNSYDTGKLTNKINIMTVHKAKGLESETVTIVNSTFQPKTFINKKTGKEIVPPQWMIEQMNNLKYVAYTRAINKLNILSIPEDEIKKTIKQKKTI